MSMRKYLNSSSYINRATRPGGPLDRIRRGELGGKGRMSKKEFNRLADEADRERQLERGKSEHMRVAEAYADKELGRKAAVTGVLVNSRGESIVLFRTLDSGGDFALVLDSNKRVTDETEPDDFFRNGGKETWPVPPRHRDDPKRILAENRGERNVMRNAKARANAYAKNIGTSGDYNTAAANLKEATNAAEDYQRARQRRIENINRRRTARGKKPLGTGHPGDKPGHPFRGNQYS